MPRPQFGRLPANFDMRLLAVTPLLAAALQLNRPAHVAGFVFIAACIPWLWLSATNFKFGTVGFAWIRSFVFGPALAMLERPAFASLLFAASSIAAAASFAPPADIGIATTIGLGFALFPAMGRKGPQWLSAAVASLRMTAAATCVLWMLDLSATPGGIVVAIGLLLAAVVYYLLAFCDPHGESDADALVVAVLIGWALAQIELPLALRALCVLLPLGAYVVYCERIRSGLNAFKATLRGKAAADRGDAVGSLEQFAVALRFAPHSKAMAENYWNAHYRIDLNSAFKDPRLAPLIDPEFCVRHVESVLDSLPDSQAASNTRHLLALVEEKDPRREFSVGRLKARTDLIENAVECALSKLDSICSAKPAAIVALPEGEAMELAKCWLLALTDPRLVAAGSLAWLDGPRLLDALCSLHAVEAKLPECADLSTFLYRKVTEERLGQFRQREPDADLTWIAVDRLNAAAHRAWNEGDRQDGIALLAAASSIAARPILLWRQLSQWEEESGSNHADDWRTRIRDWAKSRLPNGLDQSETASFIDACRRLAHIARDRRTPREAVDNLELLVVHHLAGEATHRTLLELYEELGDAIGAVRQAEAALTFALAPDVKQFWRSTKDRLYAELSPTTVAAQPKPAVRFLDFEYCLQRARTALQQGRPSDECERYLLLAKCGGMDYRAESEHCLGLLACRLEQWAAAADHFAIALAARPKSFRSDEQRRTHVDALRKLADLYLDQLDRTAEAIPLLLELERELASGAATLFKLGRAYERINDVANARKWYDMVQVYSGHPLAEEARAALLRLQPNAA